MLRHLETQHPEFKCKEGGFFRVKLNNLNVQKELLSESLGIEVMSGFTEASYRVSHIIGKQGKPHTIAESLILPCAKVMVECVLGEKAAKKLDKIPLSNNTVSRRTDDIALQIKNSLIEMIRKSRFYALQLDESNDMSKFAELMAYVRFEDDGKIKEEYLFC
jgi:zinc finger BED domain-containing protein 5/7/8/9